VRVMPCRRSTPSAASSRVRHASGSFESTGRLAARSRRPRHDRCSSTFAQRGKQRCSWRPASVSRACAASNSRSDWLPCWSRPAGERVCPEDVERVAGEATSMPKELPDLVLDTLAGLLADGSNYDYDGTSHGGPRA
jgi:hypothetical protein